MIDILDLKTLADYLAYSKKQQESLFTCLHVMFYN